MKTRCLRLAAIVCLFAALHSSAATLYVNLNSPGPVAPYTNWATAATNIQDAVDAAANGDVVLVTNGIYQNGGHALAPYLLTNRVAITNAITVQSVNGPSVTTIQGYQVPGTTNGDSAVRGAFVGNFAKLIGFTLSGGATRATGDSQFEESGGGAFLNGSSASASGCVYVGNSAAMRGGAVHGFISIFGGLPSAVVANSVLVSNVSGFGGGASQCILNNCYIAANTAASSGGGVWVSSLNNCTVVSNFAGSSGGGTSGLSFNNSIIYGNSSGGSSSNYSSGTFNYCCTAPLPGSGAGNISADPLFLAAPALSPVSSCVGAGSSAYTTGVDLLGQYWTIPPSMGCEELLPPVGPLTVAFQPPQTQLLTNAPVTLIATVTGRASELLWNFGDGAQVSNQLSVTHAWSTAGNYQVVLTAFNASNPGGVSLTNTVSVVNFLTHYVNLANASPVSPYLTWAAAAANIQNAIDVANPGDLILVSNGVYQTGGRVVYGSVMTNRVVINKAVTVQSVNGPSVTVIKGYQLPVVINGDGAIRCVYLTNGAVLTGFTLTGGGTRVSGDVDHERTGGGTWTEGITCTVSNCIYTFNSAGDNGAGAFGYSQTPSFRGGTLNNCVFMSNSTYWSGAGASSCLLNNCYLTGNVSTSPGGGGAGIVNSVAYNTTIIGNTTYGPNCGGAYGSSLANCIIYGNFGSGTSNYATSTLSYCDAAPLASGAGNFSADPQFADSFHLLAASPCRGAGSTNYTSGVDLDGEAWASPPDIGCDQYTPGQITGPLSVSIVPGANPTGTNQPTTLTALVTGRFNALVWSFGDGTHATNVQPALHSWPSTGNYQVTVAVYNDANPGGVRATNIILVVPAVHFVRAGSATPAAPYSSWASAAANIQDAADVAANGDYVVVTNGVYTHGGRTALGLFLTNRVMVTNAVTVQSVNGPAVTLIQGAQAGAFPALGPSAIRGVWLGNGSTLIGFTVTNGATSNGQQDNDNLGGGIFCASSNVIVSNCQIVSNAAVSGGGIFGGAPRNCSVMENYAVFNGGGAFQSSLANCQISGNQEGNGQGAGACLCTLSNCVVFGNAAGADAVSGGADSCLLINCMVAGNSGPFGGGTFNCTNYNSIIYSNTSEFGDDLGSTFAFCCTPSPGGGIGNITTAPLFANLAAGNLRLQSNSPCINAGNNAYAPAGTDLDGNPRISGGTVDIGAYEFQNPASAISYAWLQQYGLPTDGSADNLDPDHDGMSNWQEWRASTNPTNAASVLQLLSPARTGTNLTVTWQSVSGINYYLQRSATLVPGSLQTIATNLPGHPGTTSYTDTNAPAPGPWFYRVGVQ